LVFKRRDTRPIWKVVAEIFYPRGGWLRAFRYVRHRMHRLPDPPHRIARGIFAGIFTSFTPFFGMHFVTAAIIAKLMRGNIIASLLATFFGNPLTFPFIAAASLKTGHWLLGASFDKDQGHSLTGTFVAAGRDFWDNFLALFSDKDANWAALHNFNNEIFLPYLIGGVIPGVICGLIGYYMSVPVIAAYQNRRKGRLKKKLAELRAKASKKADDAKQAD